MRTETILPYENLYGPLTEATQIEETPFFQEYLSLFNPDRELEGLTLWTEDADYEGGKKPLFNGPEPSVDDYKMLQLLIIGSFSNRYSIIPGPQPGLQHGSRRAAVERAGHMHPAVRRHGADYIHVL